MKKIEHSRSPWNRRESEYDPSVWEIMSGWCESPIAEVPRWQDDDGNDSEEAEANARLITAAPALLAALTKCAALLADYDEYAGEEGEAYRDAIAAIAKATPA